MHIEVMIVLGRSNMAAILLPELGWISIYTINPKMKRSLTTV